MKTLLLILRLWLLKKLLRDDQLAVVAALEEPARWMPDPAMTPAEAETWGAALKTPLMVKIDHAMINWVQQEAQRALQSPAPELPRMAGFALGARAGWEMAKTLSRLPAANDGQTEQPGTTAPGDLEHARP